MHLAAEAQFEPKKRKKAHEAKQEPAEEAEFKQRERKPSVKRQAVQDEEAERGTKKRHKAPDSQKAPPAAQSQKAPPEAESQKAQPEAESAAQKPAQEAACSASGHKRDNGADSLDSIEHEKQLAWKKEKRRKQNREAQRRRRDRLMNSPQALPCTESDDELIAMVAGCASRSAAFAAPEPAPKPAQEAASPQALPCTESDDELIAMLAAPEPAPKPEWPPASNNGVKQKLRAEDVREIFAHRFDNTKALSTQLAERFGISARSVQYIWKRERWREATQYVSNSTPCMICSW